LKDPEIEAIHRELGLPGRPARIDMEGQIIRAGKREATAPTHAPTATGPEHAQALAGTICKLAGESHGLAHLGKIRAAHPELTREQFDAALQAARRAGLITLSPAEGRHGVSEADRQAAIHEVDPLTGRRDAMLLYAASKRHAERFSEGARLSAVSIFAAGTHRGKTYTPADLDAIAENFNAFSSGPKPRLRVPAVIGHEESGDGGLMDRTDIPAAGWLSRVWRDGSVLKADIENIPPNVARLLKGKAYRTVSAEIYDRPPEGIPAQGKVLRRVAFLGGEIPEVKSLDEIPAVEGMAEDRRVPRTRLVIRCFTERRRPGRTPFTICAFGEERTMPVAQRSARRFATDTEEPRSGKPDETDAQGFDLDREEKMKKLEQCGYDREAIADASDEMLDECLRVHGTGGEGEDMLPEPESAEELAEFKKRARHYLDRAKRIAEHFGIDEHMQGRTFLEGRTSGSGHATFPMLSAAEFDKNRRGFEAMGIRSHAEAVKALQAGGPTNTELEGPPDEPPGEGNHGRDRQHEGDEEYGEEGFTTAGSRQQDGTDMRSGEQGHAAQGRDTDAAYHPRQDRAGGTAWHSAAQLRREGPEAALFQFAERFAQKHRADFAALGVSVESFADTYSKATPRQRAELIPGGR
jgi:hypothetical protein